MSYLLAVLALILIPANPVMSGLILMFTVPGRRMKKSAIHWLLISLLVWAGIGAALCLHKMDAFYGFPMRMEGIITWVIVGRLAWVYWEYFDEVRA